VNAASVQTLNIIELMGKQSKKDNAKKQKLLNQAFKPKPKDK
jgi:hypothetical protein